MLDELNIVLRNDTLPIEEIVEFLKERPLDKHICITGRDAKPELLELADLITEFTEVKHPYKAGFKAQKGRRVLMRVRASLWRCAGAERWRLMRPSAPRIVSINPCVDAILVQVADARADRGHQPLLAGSRRPHRFRSRLRGAFTSLPARQRKWWRSRRTW